MLHVLTDLFYVLDEKQRESDSEEEQPKSKIVCSPPPTSQKVPIFPGLSPTALIVSALSIPVVLIYNVIKTGSI